MSRSEVTTTWKYADSVARVRPMVLRWGKLTIDMLGELHTARDELSHQGARTDLTSGQMSRSWDSYCSDVGLEKRTANRWLAKYDPVKRCLLELPAPKIAEPQEQPERTYTTKHGSTATMDTSRIGRKRAEPEPEDDEQEPIAEPETAGTEPDIAFAALKTYIDIAIGTVKEVSAKHMLINEMIKYLRGLSIELNREAGSRGVSDE